MMKRWKKTISRFMAAAMIVGNVAAAMPINALAADKLLTNGGFEEADLNGWTKNDWCQSGGATMEQVDSAGGITPAEGSYCLKEEAAGRGSQVTQKVPNLTAGKEYWVTGQMYQTTANSYSLGIHENEGKGSDPQFAVADSDKVDEWVKAAVRFTMWENAQNCNVYTWLNAEAAAAYLDDVQLFAAQDFSKLETVIADAEGKLLETDTYTQESLNALGEKVTAAKEYTDKNSYAASQKTQTEIDAMEQEVSAAIGNLKNTSNILVNGNFADGLNNWGKWPENAVITQGEEDGIPYTAYDAETQAENGINQDVTLVPGAWYKLSAEVYADTVQAVSIGQESKDKTDKTWAENTKTGEWETIFKKFQVPENVTTKNIYVWLAKGTAKVRNVKLVETEADTVITSNATFYIDAEGGSDDNNGTSPEKAWKTFANVEKLRLEAGGKLLLKAGCTWNNEQLKLQEAAGTADKPVVLGRYGEGADPIINGNGNPWQTDVKAPKQDVAVVHLYNCKYTTVENLEVTNWESDEADLVNDSSNPKYKQSKYLLTGILAENHDAGDLPGVVVKNNYVHDVNSYMQPESRKGAGGIIALVTGEGVKSWFTDLKLEGNKVEKVSHEAIYMESSWATRVLVGTDQGAGVGTWVGWPDVYVANNYVNNTAGDGIVLINADGGIAEYNLVVRSGSEDWDYSRNPAHAAIWMWDCNNVTMQYNEAAHTETYQDGMAFDFDYGNQNVMYQYNYSHDNKGGFWMACPGPYYTVNGVARYNLSVNDGLFDGARNMRIGESGSIGIQVYNNTIYWDHDYKINAVEQATWGSGPSSGTDIYNNIIYGNSDTCVNNEGVNYSNNCVYGTIADVYPIDEDVNAIVADPQFVDTKAYTEGSFADGKVTLGNADGFQLKPASYCIDAGTGFMAVPEESLEAVKDELVKTNITLTDVDYAGKAAPYAGGKLDIGAFEYQGEGDAEKPVKDASYLEALVAMAKGYDKEAFVGTSYEALEAALAKAETVLKHEFATQDMINIFADKLEAAVKGLTKKSDIIENDPDTAANVLTDEQAYFENGTGGWGEWQSTVTTSQDSAHGGNYSLKVDKTGDGTAYAELGGIPVKKDTAYVCQAWVKFTAREAGDVAIEAKHHNNVTGSGDIKLGNAKPDASSDENGWRKVTLAFTTQGYDKISLSINSDVASVQLDDVFLYEKYTVKDKQVLDETKANEALALVPEHEEAYYTAASWKTYQDAIMAVKLEMVNTNATQETLDAAAVALTDAYHALTKEGVSKDALRKLYYDHKDDKQGNYTDETWNAFQTALSEAGKVLEDQNADQAAVDAAWTALDGAIKALKENQEADAKPVNPVNPDNSSKTDGSSKPSAGSVQTGDEAPFALLTVFLIVSGAAIIIIGKKRRYQK